MTDQTKVKITLPSCPFEISSPVDFEGRSEIQFKNPKDEVERQQIVADREANKNW